MHDPDTAADRFTLRNELRAGDIGTVVLLHGQLYAREQGFDHTFEAYVAKPLAEFAIAASPRERIWLAERGGRIVGSIAIVDAGGAVAQLRWFLVHPDARGGGLGRRLVDEAIAFSRSCGYRTIVLWTVDRLLAAAQVYRAAGFRKVEQNPGRPWGVELVEEKYELLLAP